MATREQIIRSLDQTAFSAAECESALRGQTPLPKHLGNCVVQLCLVSGIRKHVDLARSVDVADLCRIEGQDIFARARNARLIMSNEVPDREQMRGKSEYPTASATRTSPAKIPTVV